MPMALPEKSPKFGMDPDKRDYLVVFGVVVFLAVGPALGVMALSTPKPPPITIYLPAASQEIGSLCISNRSGSKVEVFNGPVLNPSSMVTAQVVRDYAWGFSDVKPSTDRQDVDCLVIGD